MPRCDLRGKPRSQKRRGDRLVPGASCRCLKTEHSQECQSLVERHFERISEDLHSFGVLEPHARLPEQTLPSERDGSRVLQKQPSRMNYAESEVSGYGQLV